MLKIYQSGPIAGCDDEECISWRQDLKDRYQDIPNAQVKFIDPMRRDYRQLDRDQKLSSFEDQKKIVTLDKADIIRSDAMIVWTGLPFPSAGTSMEIMYAFEHGVYVLTVNPRKVVLSPWVYYHSNKIVTDLDAAMKVILDYFNE